eukprot:gene42483-52690_t
MVPTQGVTLTKESTLEVVSLATSETLTFRPIPSASSTSTSSSEVMTVMSRQDAEGFTVTSNGSAASGTTSEATKSATSLLLSGCLKSLSTLTRVVQVLRGNTNTPSALATGEVSAAISTSSSAADSSKKKHVPYRDSVLTRLLRRSLHGNCYMAMLTFVTAASGADNVARILRFAAEIGGLYNYISINQQVLQSAAGVLTRAASVVSPQGGMEATIEQ